MSNENNLLILLVGEIYVGKLMAKNHKEYQIVLMPEDSKHAAWQKQMDWANSIGGVLPDCAEQKLLLEKCADQFQKDWHWSSTQNAEFHGSACAQNFDISNISNQVLGNHGDFGKLTKMRARAIRRIPV